MLHEICNTTDIIFCHFGPLYAILPPENPENENFEKIKKNAWKYHYFTQV